MTPSQTAEINTGSTPTLLPLKLIAPPARDNSRPRADLQALLAEVRVQPLTLVVAPAGYGKTTLLAHWAADLARTGAPTCWLTIDQGERDVSALLAYLIQTFQSVAPAIGADATRVLRSAANIERDWPLVAGALCGELQRRLPTATFLFLDDLHSVADAALIGQVFGYLLRAAPPTLHVIMASRRLPAFAPIGRMRAEGQLLELTQRDLFLSAGEARNLLDAQGVVLDDDALGLLLRRTDGWALSVQLAARALAEQPEAQRAAYVRALGGGQERLLHYLSTEVLSELPAEVLHFLRIAAMPAYFDAALLTEVIGSDDAAYLLQRTRALGLPITQVDDQGAKLRIHPLWRELLLSEASTVIDAATRATYQLGFGRAFEQRGDLDQALEHYAAADAAGDLARVLREHAAALLASPRREALRSWIERIAPDVRAHDPELLLLEGNARLNSDADQAALRFAAAADLFRAQERYDGELRACSELAALLFLQGRWDRFLAICVRAVRAANTARDPWSRGASLVCVAAMLSTKGRFTAALRVAHHAAANPLNPSWRWLMAMTVASVATQLGRPADALAVTDEALRVPQLDADDRLRQNLLRQRAQALFQLGQTQEAIAVAIETHRYLSDYYQDGTAGFSAMYLALMLMQIGRIDEANSYIAQARTTFHAMGALAPLARLQAIEQYGLLGRDQAARAAASVSGLLHRLDEAEGFAADLRLRLLAVLMLGEAGRHERAYQLAQVLIGQMQARGYRLFLASASLYAASIAVRAGAPGNYDALLRLGWQIVADDRLRYLPMLPAAALRDTAIAALRSGIHADAVGAVLAQQMPDATTELLQDLVNDGDAAVRTRAATLLGQQGSPAAYPALRQLLKDRSPAVRQAAETALAGLSYRPLYTLHIRTLGAFVIWRGEQEVRDRDWRSSKARQLFQLLMTERGRALPRDRVLDQLWPEMESEAAANNLRVTLNRLSKAIEPDRPEGAPPSYLVQNGDTYSFNSESAVTIDAADFAAAVIEGQRADTNGRRAAAMVAYRRAIGLYGGPYLPDALYEDWSVIERERLAMLFNEVALRLGRMVLDEGAAHEAIGLAWRVLEHDRANEDSYRLLMHAHAQLGERSIALRIYARCTEALQTELGVEPMPDTVLLYESLRTAAQPALPAA